MSENGYTETYDLTKSGGSERVTVPKPVIRRKAEELGLSIEEFIKQYSVEAVYGKEDDDADVSYRFKKKEEEKDG